MNGATAPSSSDPRPLGIVRVFDIIEKDRKFVSPQARDCEVSVSPSRATVSWTANTSPADWLLQAEVIPDQMPHAVVDHLEPSRSMNKTGTNDFAALHMLDEPTYAIYK